MPRIFVKYAEFLEELGLRRGKYHNYKLDLLRYLVDNDFVIKIGDNMESSQWSNILRMPSSSWYDITRDLENSGFIIMRRKNIPKAGIIVYTVYEIQLTKKGLKFLTRFGTA